MPDFVSPLDRRHLRGEGRRSMTPTELRALAAAATPRPWELVPGYERDLLEDMLHADAEYAFAAANAVPDLLDRIEVLEGALREVEEAAEDYRALDASEAGPTLAMEIVGRLAAACAGARAALEGADRDKDAADRLNEAHLYRRGLVGIEEVRKRAADVANQAFMLADPTRLAYEGNDR